jgi:RNA polymerase sigma-70 factor (ECF subfamily)
MKPSATTPSAAAVGTDAAIVARLCDGDLGALGELYDRHQQAVRTFVARATSNAADVDDLVQNTFLGAARIATRYDQSRTSCRPWLIGIAANLVQRRGRTLGQTVRMLTRFAVERSSARDPRPQLEARNGLQRIAAVIERMDPSRRVVVLLAEVEGLSCQEIADALGIAIGTVWGRLHAARRELREVLPDEVPW